jgi:hypothetical protein
MCLPACTHRLHALRELGDVDHPTTAGLVTDNATVIVSEGHVFRKPEDVLDVR